MITPDSKLFVISLYTKNGMRFYLTDGDRRMPGGFAKREDAEEKARWMNDRSGVHREAEADGIRG